MKTKEKIIWFCFYGFWVLVLVSIIVFWKPELDVCDELTIVSCGVVPEYWNENQIYEYCSMKQEINNLKGEKPECTKYHKKTFCEKCVDVWDLGQTDECSEKCACDEYKIKVGNGELLSEIEFIERNFNNPNWKPTRGELEIMFYLNKQCISAHEKNECEKGNDYYVWDIEKYYEVKKLYCRINGKDCSNPTVFKNCIYSNSTLMPSKGWSYEGNTLIVFAHINCSEFEKEKAVCRPKTINDLSCAELEEAWEKGGWYERDYINYHWWWWNREEDGEKFVFKKQYSTEEITHIQLSKGCFE